MRVASVAPYVPELLSAWRPTHGDARHMRVEGSLALVDISGFTQLTERLARQGRAGAEELSDLLDATFSALLREAQEEGGDLVKWGGDAVLLLFSGGGHAPRACRAAWSMRAALRSLGPLRTTRGTVTLRMSTGVHSGLFDLYLVGDPAHHRELLVVGPGASRTALLESMATPGQVLVSDGTAEHLSATTHRPGPADGTRVLRSKPEVPVALPAQRTEPIDGARLYQYLSRVVRDQVLAERGEAEHRCVAVAFVRFSGTDALSESMGVIGVADALDQCVRNVQAAASDHDVTFLETDVDRDGGKIMLVAGAPSSSGRNEEQVLRAVRLVMDRAGVLPLQIGVNRGDVFAGDFGPSFRRTYSVKGDAVNLAARVTGRAAHGEVLATTATLERSRARFLTTPLEPFFVKGKASAVVAAGVGELLGRDGSGTPATGFVGRDAELALLRSAVQDAARGIGGEVDVVGEAGIGKSRLVAELLAGAPELQVHSGVGQEYESTTPYSVFRGLLRTVLGLRRDAGAEETADRLCEVVATAAPDLAPWLPLLAVPLDVTVAATREASELDEHYRGPRLEEAVERLLAALLTDPTVVLVEDAHLLDEASSKLLARLAGRVAVRTWLVVVTRRDSTSGYVPRTGPRLLTVRMPPLTGPESAKLVRSATRVPMTQEVTAALLSRSGGNPMFLEELVLSAGHLGSGELPESVQAMITSQVDRLSPVDRLVLRYAAVLGTVARVSVLEQLLAVYRDDVRLADHLPALRGLLDPDGPGRVRFRHALVREVAYEGLPYGRRRILHGHVAEALERLAVDPARVSALLSLHFFAAGAFDRAWTYSRTAGLQAREKYANGEAIELFQRALEAARRGDGIDTEIAEVLEALGDVREIAGRSAEAVEAFRSARRHRAGDPVAVANLVFKQARTEQRLGRVTQSLRMLRRSLGSLDGIGGTAAHASRSRLATQYAWGRIRQGRYADALRWAGLAARQAEDSGDKQVLAHAYNGLQLASFNAGEPMDIPYGLVALRAYEELQDLGGQGHCVNNLGVEAFHAGRLEEAAAFFARARQSFRRVGDEANEANATYNQADALLRAGRLAEAEPLLFDALGIARAVGDPELVAMVQRESGRVQLGLGQLAEAGELLAAARTGLTALGLVQELVSVEQAEDELRLLTAGAAD